MKNWNESQVESGEDSDLNSVLSDEDMAPPPVEVMAAKTVVDLGETMEGESFSFQDKYQIGCHIIGCELRHLQKLVEHANSKTTQSEGLSSHCCMFRWWWEVKAPKGENLSSSLPVQYPKIKGLKK